MAATGWGVTFSDGSFFPFKSGNVQDDEMNAKHFSSLNASEGAIASPLGGTVAYDKEFVAAQDPDMLLADLIRRDEFICGG